MNNQNQNQQMNQNLSNAQAVNARMNMENASDLAQSSGAISRLLLSKSKSGFEFGNMGSLQGQAQSVSANNTQSNVGAAQQKFNSQNFEFGNLSTNAMEKTPVAITNANAQQAQQKFNTQNFEFGNLSTNAMEKTPVAVTNANARQAHQKLNS